MKAHNITVLIAILLILPLATFAQHTEAQLFAKQQAMQNECDKISKVVPCAIGIGDVDDLPLALESAENDARYKLAQSLKVFVSYAVKDTAFIDGVVSKKFKEVSGKISIDSIALINSQTRGNPEYGEITKKGETFYRVIILMVLDPQLYEEAKMEITPTPQPQSSQSIALASSSSQATQPNQKPNTQLPDNIKHKIDYKKIATKTATLLLKIAGRVIGL